MCSFQKGHPNQNGGCPKFPGSAPGWLSVYVVVCFGFALNFGVIMPSYWTVAHVECCWFYLALDVTLMFWDIVNAWYILNNEVGIMLYYHQITWRINECGVVYVNCVVARAGYRPQKCVGAGGGYIVPLQSPVGPPMAASLCLSATVPMLLVDSSRNRAFWRVPKFNAFVRRTPWT